MKINIKDKERIVLGKAGYNNIIIRRNGNGYELLEYTDHYGGERWTKLPQSNDVIEKQIEQLGINTVP